MMALLQYDVCARNGSCLQSLVSVCVPHALAVFMRTLLLVYSCARAVFSSSSHVLFYSSTGVRDIWVRVENGEHLTCFSGPLATKVSQQMKPGAFSVLKMLQDCQNEGESDELGGGQQGGGKGRTSWGFFTPYIHVFSPLNSIYLKLISHLSFL